MNEEQAMGLAQQQQPQPMMDGSGQGQGQGQRQMIDEVKQMLMQGATPEQLEQQGIPPEIIQMAIAELQQEMAAQQPQQPQMDPMGQGAGLAQQQVM